MTSTSANIQSIVGRYIRETAPSALEPYLQETGLTEQQLDRPLPDLRSIVEAYESSLFSSQISKLQLHTTKTTNQNEDALKLLSKTLPEKDILKEIERTIEGISIGNLLGCWIEPIGRRKFETSSASYRADYPLRILITSVDKTLKLIDYDTGEVETILSPHKAAILSVSVHPVLRRYVITGSMDGTAVLSDLITSEPIQTFTHSSSGRINLTAFSPTGNHLATSASDKTIQIYSVSQPHPVLGEDETEILDDTDLAELAAEAGLRYELCHKIKVEGNPESMVFTEEYLIYTIRSSHLLYFLSLPASKGEGMEVDGTEPWQLRTKSFNPSPLDTHVSFSVLHLALHPGGKLVACLTGDPATVGAGERVLIYSTDFSEPDVPISSGMISPAGEAEDGEGERLACLWTGEVGDRYVLPRMVWLPDGSGIVTTTTSGNLNLIDLTGQVRSRLKVHGGMSNGQEASGVVRDVAVTGQADDADSWRFVSVGYDGKVQVSK